jgi:putative NIF3 family GTP cyclohydrolase 1 type 2
MTLLRCHDTWDRMPEFGIPDAWARFLGFSSEERPVESFYKTCLLDSITVKRAAELIAERVRVLGQEVVLVFGDQDRIVNRMVVGTGAITRFPRMYELKPDLILATDDGMKSYAGWLWAADLDIPIIIVNHATSEKPGMMAMVEYLGTVFDDVPIEYIDVGAPYTAVRVAGGG